MLSTQIRKTGLDYVSGSLMIVREDNAQWAELFQYVKPCSHKPCTWLDPQCRKIHDPGAMDFAPSSARGPWKMHVSFDWEHSSRAMILGTIVYKDSV